MNMILSELTQYGKQKGEKRGCLLLDGQAFFLLGDKPCPVAEIKLQLKCEDINWSLTEPTEDFLLWIKDEQGHICTSNRLLPCSAQLFISLSVPYDKTIDTPLHILFLARANHFYSAFYVDSALHELIAELCHDPPLAIWYDKEITQLAETNTSEILKAITKLYLSINNTNPINTN